MCAASSKTPIITAAVATAWVLMTAGCAHGRATSHEATPVDGGATEVVFETHLPNGLRISRVVAMMDGQTVYASDDANSNNNDNNDNRPGRPARKSIFRAKLPEGEHTLNILVRVDAEPHGSLVIKDARSFDVGPAGGGTVHLDAFAREPPWRGEEERVELRMTLRGMRADHALSEIESAKHVCGLNRDRGGEPRADQAEQETRCIVQQLLERYRAQRDIIAFMCEKDKLSAIDRALGALPTTDGPARVALETRIEQLGREAATECARDR